MLEAESKRLQSKFKPNCKVDGIGEVELHTKINSNNSDTKINSNNSGDSYSWTRLYKMIYTKDGMTRECSAREVFTKTTSSINIKWIYDDWPDIDTAPAPIHTAPVHRVEPSKFGSQYLVTLSYLS
jgi:hypothetical protein